MDVIIEQYFDVGLMLDEFDPVFDGFQQTILLSIFGGVLSLLWGLVLAVLRQLPGRALAPVRCAHDRLHRRLPRHPAAAGAPAHLRRLRRARARGRDPARRSASPRSFGQPDPFWYGVMGLTITYGAYMAEVYRAGIEAVPHGQMEAARSLGMSHGQSMRYVIVPQAVRTVIPPLLNDFIALMKDTSLVSVLGLARGGPGWARRPGGVVQQLGADARGAVVPRRHDPARAAGRLADRAPAAQDRARRRRRRRGASRRQPPTGHGGGLG